MYLSQNQIDDYRNYGAIIIKDAFKDWIEPLRNGFQTVLNEPSQHGRENINDNKKIFIKWLILLPIKTNAKDNRIPTKKIGVMFKLVKLKPCRVAMIFQIDKIHVRKKDEIIKKIARDLNFISPLSN